MITSSSRRWNTEYDSDRGTRSHTAFNQNSFAAEPVSISITTEVDVARSIHRGMGDSRRGSRVKVASLEEHGHEDIYGAPKVPSHLHLGPSSE